MGIENTHFLSQASFYLNLYAIAVHKHIACQ